MKRHAHTQNGTENLQAKTCRRAMLVEPHNFEISETEIELKPGNIMIRLAACGLCNWELNHWKGLIGQCPMKIGHEGTGVVVGIHPDVPDGVFHLGQKVTGFFDKCFAEYTCADYRSCFPVPQNTPLEHALGEPLACVVTTLLGAEPQIGDIAVVVGCGPMGLWCIQGLAGSGLSDLIAIDIDPAKLDLARSFGATHIINPKECDSVEFIRDISDNHMADLVIEGTGRPEVLNKCQDYLRTGRGKLVLMSSHSAPAQSFDFRKAVEKSLELRVTHPSYATDLNDSMRRAVRLLGRGTFHNEKIVSHRFTLDQINAAFKALESKPEGYLKGIVLLNCELPGQLQN